MKLGLITAAFAQAGRGTRFGHETTKRLGFDAAAAAAAGFTSRRLRAASARIP